ncbi:AraC family transcriptional regulator [Caballeronia calidae]|uniref:AraC family transcriptional regulator n=1 Tax=Caballeronia calidae TaxID=1777139 RepID=A0A158C138_9BURK|nr:helix-turn-helix domain-containing protein [Caballeronia calidae]SAK75247.1 AraC family transcriptional regulator [Caballeronia calidae]
MEGFTDGRGVSEFKREVAKRPETQQRVAIALYEHFSLLDVSGIAEVFNLANRLHSSSEHDFSMFTVSLLSTHGGAVSSTSGVRVSTHSFDARYASGFDALFIAGGVGATVAAQDESTLSWVRDLSRETRLLYACGEGRLVLNAAGIPADDIHRPDPDVEDRESAAFISVQARLRAIDEPLSVALSFVQASNHQTARRVADRLMARSEEPAERASNETALEPVSDAIRHAVQRMRQDCEKVITVSELARTAAMSERNFLRRFKEEMQMTPSEFLTTVRLEKACHLLTRRELPVGTVARRSGFGAGDRLAKIFRQRFAMSPTEYRLASRRTSGTS